jgi:hypothetical protein
MSYQEQLLKTIRKWKKDPIEDEWLFDKFRREFIGLMSSESAYQAIGETVEVLLEEKDPSRVTELVQSLFALALQSATTEVPNALLQRRSDVELLAATAGGYAEQKLRELFNYYRLQ